MRSKGAWTACCMQYPTTPGAPSMALRLQVYIEYLAVPLQAECTLRSLGPRGSKCRSLHTAGQGHQGLDSCQHYGRIFLFQPYSSMCLRDTSNCHWALFRPILHILYIYIQCRYTRTHSVHKKINKMCVSIYAYMYICTHIYIKRCTYVHTYTHIHVCVQIDTYIYIYKYLCLFSVCTCGFRVA